METCIFRASLFPPRICPNFRTLTRSSILVSSGSALILRPRFKVPDWRRRGLFVCQSNSISDSVDTFQSEKGLRSTRISSSIREKVETAVQRQGYRVTVGDVSGSAGVTLSEAEEALQALAADSLGSLEVHFVSCSCFDDFCV